MRHKKQLSHAFGFGNKSHKYIAKVPSGRDYRYFYNTDEYRTYQQGQGGEKKRSVWSTLGAVGSVTGNQGLITFANTMNLLENHHSKPASVTPSRSDRPHSRRVKIGRGTATVRKRNRIGEQEIGEVAGGEEGVDAGAVDGKKEGKNKLK